MHKSDKFAVSVAIFGIFAIGLMSYVVSTLIAAL